MHASNIDFLKRLAKGIAAQFGSNCEVVVHDLKSEDPTSTIVAIENGHIVRDEFGQYGYSDSDFMDWGIFDNE